MRWLDSMANTVDMNLNKLCGMWNLPRPGIESVSLAVTGGFLTAEPPRKPNDGVCHCESVYLCDRCVC